MTIKLSKTGVLLLLRNKQEHEGTDVVELRIEAGDSAWNPGSKRVAFRGPADLTYRMTAPGVVEAEVRYPHILDTVKAARFKNGKRHCAGCFLRIKEIETDDGAVWVTVEDEAEECIR